MFTNPTPVPPFDSGGRTGAALEAALEAHLTQVRTYHAQLPAASPGLPNAGMRPLAMHLAALTLRGDPTAPTAVPLPPACSVCQDYGFLTIRAGLVPCACRPLPLPGTPPRYERCTLTNFILDRPITRSVVWQDEHITPVEQRQVVRHAHAIVQAWSAHPAGVLFLYGPVGSGKTHLAVAVGSAWRRMGGSGRYVACAALLSENIDALCATPLLVLDDLGTEEDTPAHRERWITVLSRRYTATLPTVLTANRLDFVLPQRLEDRLGETGTTVVLAVESMRSHLRAVHGGGPYG